MKKTIIVVLYLMAAGVWAGPGTRFEISPQAGIALTGQGNYGMGRGAALFAGARMDDISLGGQVAIYSFDFSLPADANATNLQGGYSMLEFLALLKKRLGDENGYFLINLGAGGALYSDNSSGTETGFVTASFTNNISELDPLAKFSFGLGFRLSPGAELYFDMGSDVAFSKGYREFFLPLEGGLNFF